MTMKMPNGYGSVIKLSGKRRKPFAVRITAGFKVVGLPDHPRAVQQFRYLEYFEKRSDAINYLANFNAGNRVREHHSITEVPTLREVYEMWIQERENSQKGIKKGLLNAYNAAFKKLEPIHDMRISNVRFADCQPIVSQYNGKSKSTVHNIITVLRGICAYAQKWEYTTVNFAEHLTCTGTESAGIHHPFSDDEAGTGYLFA